MSTEDGRKIMEATQATSDEKIEYPSLRLLIPMLVGLYFAVFLVALDRTIVATAIPAITDHFDSLGDVGWYGSAYMLTTCSFQLLLGRVYTFYNPKWVFLICVAIFELGSVLCGAAPSSIALIIGRAVSGAGASGIASGCIVIIVHTIPLAKRPAYVGLFGAAFGIASVCGPLLGGVLTSKVSWRWCFYINLPIGAVTIAVISVLLKLPHLKRKKLPLREQLSRLDPIGTALFVPAIVCLLLALQWGGTTYTWTSGIVVALLVVFVVLLILFTIVQLWKKDNATIPPRIVKKRTVVASIWYTFTANGSQFVLIYLLPIWFQAIKGVSPEQSGIDNIPLIMGLVITVILAGVLTKKTGYYNPWMIISAIVTPIGAGLITTFNVSTGHSKWIAYQALFGLGLGLGLQQGSMAVQTVLATIDVPTGASLIFFSQALGGAIFVSVANNVFDNELAKGLKGIAGIDPAAIVNTGATDLRKTVPTAALPQVLKAYNHALTSGFYVAVGLSCAAIIGALAVEWKSVKTAKPEEEQRVKGDSQQEKTGEV